MSRSKHSEAQMIEALKQVEAGRSVEEVGRAYGVSKHTVYTWKSKYGGMDVSEAQEVKALRGKHAAEKAGGKPEPGQRCAGIGDLKKPLGLVVRAATLSSVSNVRRRSSRSGCASLNAGNRKVR
jgi:putative transposase